MQTFVFTFETKILNVRLKVTELTDYFNLVCLFITKYNDNTFNGLSDRYNKVLDTRKSEVP